jgi:hypothetical protein
VDIAARNAYGHRQNDSRGVSMKGWLHLLSRVAVIGAFGAAVFSLSARAADAELKGGPMLECSGLPCVDVTVASGAVLKILVDTGNLHSVLDKGVAERLGLELKPYVGRDGKVHPEYSSAILKGVKIGGAELGEVVVLVVDLASSVAKGEIPNADGSLAYTAFGPRLLRMDYKAHRLQVSDALSAAAPCPEACGVVTTPTFGEKGPPIVATTGFSVNGKPVLVQIDTMYSGTMLIYPTSVDKLGLGAQRGLKTQRTFPYTDGGVQMIEGRAAAEGFGGKTLARNCPLYFATPEVHAPDGLFDGTVGQELFAGHVLTFDFFAHHFWMT